MNIEKAIEIIEKHNIWRRANEDMEMVNPTELGIAIDVVVMEFKNLHLQNVNGWLFISGNERLFSSSAKQNCLCRFDDGTECFYNDEHPHAILTHFKPI